MCFYRNCYFFNLDYYLLSCYCRKYVILSLISLLSVILYLTYNFLLKLWLSQCSISTLLWQLMRSDISSSCSVPFTPCRHSPEHLHPPAPAWPCGATGLEHSWCPETSPQYHHGNFLCQFCLFHMFLCSVTSDVLVAMSTAVPRSWFLNLQ